MYWAEFAGLAIGGKMGSPEGHHPSGGGLGVSPSYNFHPLPGQERGRGMVEKGFQRPARDPNGQVASDLTACLWLNWTC